MASDSDSDDSDYVPGADDDAKDDGPSPEGDDTTVGGGIRPGKRSAINDMWGEMNGGGASVVDDDLAGLAEEEAEQRQAGTKKKGGKGSRLSNKRERASPSAKDVLSGLFGKKAAGTMIRNIVASQAVNGKGKKRKRKGEGGESKGGGEVPNDVAEKTKKKRKRKTEQIGAKTGSAPSMSREEMLAVVAGVKAKMGTVEVEEVKKFAGQKIVVKRSVQKGSEEEKQLKEKAAASSSSTGLDAVLSTIGGPQKVNTVDKSSMDWDDYKEKEGLDEELSKVTKDGAGYLNKQDFLDRVDHRQFEIERGAREAKRAAASK